MESQFLARFRTLVDHVLLSHHFGQIRRFDGEPITTFNDRFQKAYSRLQAPYLVDNLSSIMVYYMTIDPLTTMFVK